MLFHISWEYIDMSETAQKRSGELFGKWQPGPAQFQALYDFADRTGGFAVVEASSASDLAKTMAPWTPFLKFSARPILPVQESVEIELAAAAWRESQ